LNEKRPFLLTYENRIRYLSHEQYEDNERDEHKPPISFHGKADHRGDDTKNWREHKYNEPGKHQVRGVKGSGT
jgi:hypothetical protein